MSFFESAVRDRTTDHPPAVAYFSRGTHASPGSVRQSVQSLQGWMPGGMSERPTRRRCHRSKSPWILAGSAVEGCEVVTKDQVCELSVAGRRAKASKFADVIAPRLIAGE